MTFTPENVLLVGAVIWFVSILLSKTGYRFGVPVLLVFLLIGMLLGVDGLGIQFDNYKYAQIIGMVALTIILFSGGMDTKFSDVKPILGPGVALSTLGVLLTTLFTGFFIYGISHAFSHVIHIPLTLALLLAATMSSTDSATVFNILRSQKMGLRNRLQPLLEFESGSNDPMAYMLTIVMIQIIQDGSADVSAWSILFNFVMQFGFGLIFGYLLGRVCVWIINKIDLIDQKKLEELVEFWHKELPNAEIFPISAAEKFGIEQLFEKIKSLLPDSPPFFEKDALTDRPERFFVNEIIREKILLNYDKEIPYAVEVMVEEFKEEGCKLFD